MNYPRRCSRNPRRTLPAVSHRIPLIADLSTRKFRVPDDERDFWSGGSRNSSSPAWKTMFCKVRCPFVPFVRERARARVYLPLYVTRERKENFSPLPTISFALRQFRASAAQKRISARTVVFRDAMLRDVFPASTLRAIPYLSFAIPLPPCPRRPFFFCSFCSFSYFPILLRLEFARPYLRHVPPVQLRPPPPAPPTILPFPFYYFSSFFQPLPPEHSSLFRSP